MKKNSPLFLLLLLQNRKNQLFQVPVTALTATAPRAVADDVLSSLGIRGTAREFALSFFRPNLTLRVLPKPSGRCPETGEPAALAALADFVCAPERERSCGIVYCLSRDEAEETAAFLRDEAGVAAAPYHAGMPSKQREAVQQAWRRHSEEEEEGGDGSGGGKDNNSVRVVVATIAFGMGIDKAAVRFVAHATLAKCLAGYFQEAGRAGVRRKFFFGVFCCFICSVCRKSFGFEKKKAKKNSLFPSKKTNKRNSNSATGSPPSASSSSPSATSRASGPCCGCQAAEAEAVAPLTRAKRPGTSEGAPPSSR